MGKFIENNAKRSAKFFIVGGISFLISEGLLLLFILITGYSYIIEVEIMATASAVAVGFYLNEIWTASGQGWHGGGKTGFLSRLGKFELISLAGSAESVLLQLFLLFKFSISPLIGNLLGSIIAAPINYAVSMLLVWKINMLKQ